MSQSLGDRISVRVDSALRDPEIAAAARGLELRARLVCDGAGCDIAFSNGAIRRDEIVGEPDIVISAASEVWQLVLAGPPPIAHQSFTALQLTNSQVKIAGDPLRIAQARPALERLFECLRDPVPTQSWPVAPRDLSQVRGRYASVKVDGSVLDLFVEEAGSGTPVLMLHTAGADSRQYQALLADPELARQWRLMAFDCPFHGRSLPPLNWDGGTYRLDKRTYLSWIAAFIEQVLHGEPVVLVGCSMGAAIALTMAAEHPGLLRSVVALEPPLRSPGRRNPYLAHACVSGGAHNAAYVRGLMSPISPENLRRRAAWIYSQGGPGVYAGDLEFYSEEFDGAVIAPLIDTARCPVYLLTGEYDYSASVKDGEALARLIHGSRFIAMPGLGHFPMSENPDLFRTYFLPVLAEIGAEIAKAPERS